MISPTRSGRGVVLHLPQSKQEIYLSVIYKGQSPAAPSPGGRQVGCPERPGPLRGHACLSRAGMASPRVGLQMEAVICPFLPELLPLIPHQDILRPGRNH